MVSRRTATPRSLALQDRQQSRQYLHLAGVPEVGEVEKVGVLQLWELSDTAPADFLAELSLEGRAGVLRQEQGGVIGGLQEDVDQLE